MPTVTYPRGVWSAISGTTVPDTIKNNPGLVAIGVGDDWDHIQTGPDTYNWSTLDNAIAAAKAAGFTKIGIAVGMSLGRTPQFVLDSMPESEVILIKDLASIHPTYCELVPSPVFWSPTLRAARVNIIQQAGVRYTGDPAIVAVNFSGCGFGHYSNDWNIPDAVGPDPCTPGQTVNQPQQWLDAGWTVDKMLVVGKEMLDTTAAAFPSQAIKMPIGGTANALVQPFLGNDAGYASLAKLMVDYGFAQNYADRLYIQRATVDVNWGNPPSTAPGIGSDRYIKWLIAQHAPHSGLQMVTAASLGSTTNCRQGGGPNGPCGASCPADCVLQKSLDAARSYNPTFIEIWTQDAQNAALYDIVHNATSLMIGGTGDVAPVAGQRSGSRLSVISTADGLRGGGVTSSRLGERKIR